MLACPLLWFLPAQCGLLFYNLELLPIWGDEQFTLNVIAGPWAAIPSVLQYDIHPPLYYVLARLWVQLPWPGSDIAQLRALSALICLIATVVVDALWLRDARRSNRLWFLALWCLSPMLLMYSRMGRSYSLQLFIATLTIYFALRLIAEPSSNRRALAYSASAAGLLYTHYLPAISVVGATALLLVWRWVRQRKSDFLRALLVSHAIAALLYIPWAATFLFALSRVSQRDPYSLVQNFALETAVKLAYWFTSFTFGEAFPLWAIFLGAALGPAVLWLLRQGLKVPVNRLPLASLAALIGYIGAASWVSFPFVGARLLFTLPFYLLCLVAGRERRPLAGNAVCAGILLVSLGSLSAYFGKQGFLNQGYLRPFGEIARSIQEKSTRSGALLLADGYNTDPSPLLAALKGQVECVTIYGEQAEELAAKYIREERFDTIWYLRTTHDASPEGVVTRLELQAAGRYVGDEHLFMPHDVAANRWASRLLGRQPQTHYFRLTEFRKPGEGP